MRGVGVAGGLLIAFVVLKLCGVIEWSWLWVTSPAWGTFLLGTLGAIGGLTVMVLLDAIGSQKKR